MARIPNSLSRTEWAERHLEDFLSLPFVREFVFRSPQTLDTTQKEVVDILIADGVTGLLISQKCQEGPSFRTGTVAQVWGCKAAKAAAKQLRGALRTARNKAIWCEHSRRGRVEFPDGLPTIHHVIVIVEVDERVDLGPDAADLPLEFQGIPITYLSVNDFMNLAQQLRTTPELREYLNARLELPEADLRVIGDEKSLFEFYLLNNGFLQGCASRTLARSVVTEQQHRLLAILAEKAESDRYSTLLEDVADQLAIRHPDYASSISPTLLAHFDPPDARTGYLEIQRVLADLRLPDRVALGKAFHGCVTKDQVSGTDHFIYMSARLESRPDWVFVFASSKNIERPVVLQRQNALMHGARAFYEKKNCLVVIDRDRESYEVVLMRSAMPATSAEEAIGHRLFGHLRVHAEPLRLASLS